MPGRSPHRAREEFLNPLRKALSCVTRAYLHHTGGKEPGEVEALTLSQDPLRLGTRQCGTVQLLLGHQYRLVKRGPVWKVTTVKYMYHLLADEDDSELVAWHWHPVTSPYPHVHVSCGPLGKGAHVPTGRVSVESVLRFLIDDLGVPRLRDDYRTVLHGSEGPFIEHRGWHA